MGCFSSVNLKVDLDKKEPDNNKPLTLNRTEIQNITSEEHSYNLSNDGNKKENYNINNIPFDALKSFKYYYINKNYKSYDIKNEENKKKKNNKINLIKANKKNENIIENKKENCYNYIEDMDIDINLYKQYITKEDNIKKEENIIKEVNEENNNDIKNENNNNDIKIENKVLRKSIEERITKYKIKKEDENKEVEDSICNLGQSYNNNSL
jgi:hypothetical protein